MTEQKLMQQSLILQIIVSVTKYLTFSFRKALFELLKMEVDAWKKGVKLSGMKATFSSMLLLYVYFHEGRAELLNTQWTVV